MVEERRPGYLSQIGGAPVVYKGRKFGGVDEELITVVRILDVHQAWVSKATRAQWSDPLRLWAAVRCSADEAIDVRA